LNPTWGKNQVVAMEMALQEINKRGGIYGKPVETDHSHPSRQRRQMAGGQIGRRYVVTYSWAIRGFSIGHWTWMYGTFRVLQGTHARVGGHQFTPSGR
jgi:hypothetical protein